MPITRINNFRAKPGMEEALHNALLELVPTIAGSEGCDKVRMLSSMDDPADFIVYEEWVSVEAHKNAAEKIPASAISKVAPLLSGPPKGDYYAG